MALIGAVVILVAGTSSIEGWAGDDAVAGAHSLSIQKERNAISEIVGGFRDQDRSEVARLLDLTRDQREIGQRMKTISAQLLGRPYVVKPLVGSPTEQEQLVARMDGFDCTTFLETVLALAGASNVDDFLERLRQIRYAGGVISYKTRLHYVTDWNESNIRNGFLQELTRGPGTVEQTKTLSILAGFQPRPVVLNYFQRQQIGAVGEWLQDGDLIYFVSARQNLDVFHVGLVFREGARVLLRHAAHSKHKVLDQSLADFARVNRMLGFVVARPRENRVELKFHKD